MCDELSHVLAIRFDFGRLATDIPRLEIQYETTSSADFSLETKSFFTHNASC